MSAQAPQRRGPRVDMQTVADSLGVQCEYCHGPGQVTDAGRPRLQVAREMIDMMLDLNTRVQFVSGKSAADAVKVDCATCHRGVAVPKPLRDLMLEAAVREGPDAASKLYKDLRAKYYGGQSYDFSEGGLIAIARRAQTDKKLDDAVAYLQANLEYYPKSSRTYQALSQVENAKGDKAGAIKDLEKAVELDPNNQQAQAQLKQLKGQ